MCILERTSYDRHLEWSQSIVSQILQKLWWNKGILYIKQQLTVCVCCSMWKIPSFYHNFLSFRLTMLCNHSNWRSWEDLSKVHLYFAFSIMRTWHMTTDSRVNIYLKKTSTFVWVLSGQSDIKVQFSQKVLIIEAWDPAQSISHWISHQFHLWTQLQIAFLMPLCPKFDLRFYWRR